MKRTKKTTVSTGPKRLRVNRDAGWPQGGVVVFGPGEAIQGLGQVDETGLLAPQRLFNL